MNRTLGLLALLVAGAGAGGDDSHTQAADGGRTLFGGYHAEVEVWVGGVTHYGRVIVTRDGGVYLEHLDEQTRRWATEVIRRAHAPTRGWDDRTDPVRSVWCRLGRAATLAEIETANASIKISRHQLLSSR